MSPRVAAAVKRGLHTLGHYHRRLAADRLPGVAVLCYHGVSTPRARPLSFPELHQPIDELDAHFRLLRQACDPISLEQWRSALAGGAPLPTRPVLVTFDDGYRSVYRHALPLLQRHRLPALVFLCSGVIEARRHFWWDAVARARGEAAVEALKALDGRAFRAAQPAATAALDDDDPLAPMTIDEARALAAAPGIEIGSHTASHGILARADAADQRSEITADRDRLAEWCGRPPRAFAYPNGRPGVDYSGETVALVREAGFDFGFTTREGFARPGEPPLERSRFLMMAGLPAAELAHRICYSWRS